MQLSRNSQKRAENNSLTCSSDVRETVPSQRARQRSSKSITCLASCCPTALCVTCCSPRLSQSVALCSALRAARNCTCHARLTRARQHAKQVPCDIMPPARAYLRDTFRSVGCRNRLLSVLRADQACMYMQAQTLTCLNPSGLNMSNEVVETLKASQHTHPSRFFSMGVTAPRAHISTDALAKWFKASTLPPLSHISQICYTITEFGHTLTLD